MENVDHRITYQARRSVCRNGRTTEVLVVSTELEVPRLRALPPATLKCLARALATAAHLLQKSGEIEKKTVSLVETFLRRESSGTVVLRLESWDDRYRIYLEYSDTRSVCLAKIAVTTENYLRCQFQAMTVGQWNRFKRANLAVLRQVARAHAETYPYGSVREALESDRDAAVLALERLWTSSETLPRSARRAEEAKYDTSGSWQRLHAS